MQDVTSLQALASQPHLVVGCCCDGAVAVWNIMTRRCLVATDVLAASAWPEPPLGLAGAARPRRHGAVPVDLAWEVQRRRQREEEGEARRRQQARGGGAALAALPVRLLHARTSRERTGQDQGSASQQPQSHPPLR